MKLVIAILIVLTLIRIEAQKAAAPSPPGPANITAILEKAGQFTTLIRLMKNTQIADQINNQLNNSNSGITVFAPTDNAFSTLPPGTLNSLSDQQKVSLIQYHVLPSAISMSQFQTVSNPLRTQAGTVDDGEYPLNVTTVGNNNVNISTGVVNATVSNTLYSDSQLVVYQVDKVLQPLKIFKPSLALAPAPSKSKNKSETTGDAPSGTDKDSTDSSDAMKSKEDMLFLAAALILCWFAR